MKKKKNIILGISGGIAAYKIVELASRLTKMDYSVSVIMTESATKFITPLTFKAITHQVVETDLFSLSNDDEIKHIAIADRADLILIAPATANFIAKLAAGLAEDLLSTIVLAAKVPILIAPSMNVNMFENPIVQSNIKYLKKMGCKILEPAMGRLACGYSGKGRLPEPYSLVRDIEYEFSDKDLLNKKILISAGPTRERIDPVRFLSNYSSGKMGYALAERAYFRGADVTLISGPVELEADPAIETINVETAIEMKNNIINRYSKYDIIIMAAAVADYKPEITADNKIKKDFENLNNIKLKRNSDILFELGKKKLEGQLLIGFAAETEDIKNNARKKLMKKNLDLIIANDVGREDIGFKSDDNEVTIYSYNKEDKIEKKDKLEIANIILNKALELI